MADYKECKFYFEHKCVHEDAPPENPECIGKEECGAYLDGITCVSDKYKKILAKRFTQGGV